MPKTRELEVASGAEVLARWVGERVHLTAHAATAEIWNELPAYRRLADSGLRSEVEAHCRQVFAAFLGALDGRRDPRPQDFPWTASHALRRVELGIALPDFMSAFRIGQIMLWDDILEGVAARPDTQAAALRVVGQVMRTIEVGSTAAAGAYLEAQQYRVADSARLARDLLEDLIEGHPPVVAPRRAALVAAGLDEDADLVVVVASLGERGADVGPVRGCLASVSRGLVVARQDSVVAVLPVTDSSTDGVIASVRKALASMAARNVWPSVGVSGAHTGWLGVPAAYEEATHARKSLAGSPGLRMVEEMSTLDFLVHSQGDEGARLVRPAIRAFLLEDLESNGVFVTTLQAYMAANLNAKEAAIGLTVHPNTVYYRLERIAERTGCDVRRVDELIDLLLAVRLVRGD